MGLKVDIWVGIAQSGGVENVINRTAGYMKSEGISVRVIQLIWADKYWLTDDIEFYSLMQGPLTSWDMVYEKYLLFYKNNYNPDVVLVEGWPILNVFAKKLVVEGGFGFKIASRIHDSLDWYASVGLGGVEDLQYADVVLALNSKVESIVKNSLSDSTVYRVENPIDSSTIFYSDDRNITRLAYVGRFSAEKNVQSLVRVMRMLPDEWELTMIGNGPDEGSLIEYIIQEELCDRIHLVSWLEEPWKELKNAGVLLIASEREIGPLVAVEALASGMPVVTTDVGNMPDIIENGKNGYIYHGEGELVKILLEMEEGMRSIPVSAICRQSVSEYMGYNNLRKLISIIQGM